MKRMNETLNISDFGIKLIKAFEIFRPEAATLITGQRVIGYGHVLQDGEQRNLSLDAAELILRDDLEAYEALVRGSIYAPLSQNQFDALVSLAFNIGSSNFQNSEVRHALNNGRILDAANAFDVWRKADVEGRTYVVDALVRRRTAEKALFLRSSAIAGGAGKTSLSPTQDDSVEPISDDAELFDADKGIVDFAPYVKDAASFRRREDGPAGQLGLTELPERGVSDPRNDVFIDDTAIEARDEFTDELEIPHYGQQRQAKTREATSQRVDKSPIAIAAEEVSDRLDALIGDAKAKNSEGADSDVLDLSAESALIEDDLRPANDREDHPLAGKQDPAPAPHQAQIKSASDSSGDDDIATKASSLPYAIMMFIGGCLLAGGLVAQFSAALSEGSWLSWATPLAIVLGAILFLSALYYALRRRN